MLVSVSPAAVEQSAGRPVRLPLPPCREHCSSGRTERESDEFACHGVVMNGRKAEEMYCGLIGSGKVKSGLAACPGLASHHGCDPPQMSRCTFTYRQPAHQSAGQYNRPQHQFDICFDKKSDSISVSQGPGIQQIVSTSPFI
ncbi:hypothetical protein KUCAC02_029022 [Chaenocephalus aceratus]|uniref:Uncharacterized protein n=1 Tax=Chaenocephalus aceratus TaxID=36190 RepID=A0ACB9X3I9_CHAAC|nr:hypothetical protein KUCAC02_029022 [Chaenocephalus aceratus]